MKIVVQVIAYVLFCAVVGLFSFWPRLHLLGDDEAMVSLSFTHSGKHVGECRRLSQEELLALPPNMRTPDECPRERHALRVYLRLDNVTVYDETLPPSGFWADGKSTVYQRFRAPAGRHELTVGINDSGTANTFDFEKTAVLELLAGQNLVVHFDPARQQLEFE